MDNKNFNFGKFSGSNKSQDVGDAKSLSSQATHREAINLIPLGGGTPGLGILPVKANQKFSLEELLTPKLQKAEGQPYLLASLILDADSLELNREFALKIADIGQASGTFTHMGKIGHPNQIDKIYSEIRNKTLAERDKSDVRKYNELINKYGDEEFSNLVSSADIENQAEMVHLS